MSIDNLIYMVIGTILSAGSIYLMDVCSYWFIFILGIGIIYLGYPIWRD